MLEENKLLEEYFIRTKEKEKLKKELSALKAYKVRLNNYLNFKEKQLITIQRKMMLQFIYIKKYKIQLYIISETMKFLQEEINKTNHIAADKNKRIRQNNAFLANINKQVELILSKQEKRKK